MYLSSCFFYGYLQYNQRNISIISFARSGAIALEKGSVGPIGSGHHVVIRESSKLWSCFGSNTFVLGLSIGSSVFDEFEEVERTSGMFSSGCTFSKRGNLLSLSKENIPSSDKSGRFFVPLIFCLRIEQHR